MGSEGDAVTAALKFSPRMLVFTSRVMFITSEEELAVRQEVMEFSENIVGTRDFQDLLIRTIQSR